MHHGTLPTDNGVTQPSWRPKRNGFCDGPSGIPNLAINRLKASQAVALQSWAGPAVPRESPKVQELQKEAQALQLTVINKEATIQHQKIENVNLMDKAQELERQLHRAQQDVHAHKCAKELLQGPKCAVGGHEGADGTRGEQGPIGGT